MARSEIKVSVIRSFAAEQIAKKGFFLKEAGAKALPIFEQAKSQMLQDFDSHPVTQEIQAGATASSDGFEEGNLFSFIGFEAGTNPTAEVRQVLDENTRMIVKSRYATYKKDTVVYKFPVFAASLEGELSAASPVPWNTSKSWLLMVEGRGFSNINYYINRYLYDETRSFPQSRSGPAIQVKPELNTRSFKPQSYLTTIIKKFEQRFK